MIDAELTDPHHVTAGFVGEPGARTFLVQAESPDERITLLVEKEQVRGLADILTQLLARVDDTPATDWDVDAMQLREPVEPRWRAGDISVGLDPERGKFVIELAELVGDDEDDDEPREVRIWVNQDQARRLAAHAESVVAQGRPRCRLCGRPTAADGDHTCPATNGHGRLSR